MKWYLGHGLLKLGRALDKISLLFGHWEQDAHFHANRLLREHYDQLESKEAK